MTKFTVYYTRTLTDEEVIEADTLADAQAIADERQQGMMGVEYANSEEENEIEPKYMDECPECHNAECHGDLATCFTCAQINHPDLVLAYIQQANVRMMTQWNGCSMCDQTSFHCEYIQVLRPLSPTVQCSWVVVCPQCRAAIQTAISQGA